ncbi:MAG: hypothetical protein ACYC5A_06765 [Thermoleophilia bacterium]
MSDKTKYTCGDCHFIALKRHLSSCSQACPRCRHYDRDNYVCKNRVRDYCTNENIVGKIDRTYPACDDAFVYTRTPALIPPISARDYFIRTPAHRFPELDDDSTETISTVGARAPGSGQA